MMDGLLLHWMRGIVNLSEIYTFYGYTVKYCREQKLEIPDTVLYVASWLIFYINMRREEAHFLETKEGDLPDDSLSHFLMYMDQSLFLELEPCDLSFLYDFILAAGFPVGEREDDREAFEIAAAFDRQLQEQNQVSVAEGGGRPELFGAFFQDLKGLIRRVKLGAQLFDC